MVDATQTLLTPNEAERMLRISAPRLKRLIREGQIAYIDLGGGELRFDPADLAAFVDQHRKSAIPPPSPAGAPA
jgi:excisionase family DNA binding protein